MTQDPQSPDLPLADNGLAKDGPGRTPAAPKRRSKLWFIPVVMLIFFTGGIMGMYFQPPGLARVLRDDRAATGRRAPTRRLPWRSSRSRRKRWSPWSARAMWSRLAVFIPEGDVISVATPSGAGDARIAEIRVQSGRSGGGGRCAGRAGQSGRVGKRRGDGARRRLRCARQLWRRPPPPSAPAGMRRRPRWNVPQATAEKCAIGSGADHVVVRARRDDAGRARPSRRPRNRGGPRCGTCDCHPVALSKRSMLCRPILPWPQANLAAARVDLTRAEHDLESAYVRAPSAGTVLDINARAGERPGTARDH